LTLAYESRKDSEFEKRFSFSKIGDEEKIIQKKMFLNLFRIGHGNNMIFRRDIFDKVGLFDESLGVGTKGLAGEDLDIFFRILKRGYKIKYNPKAIIYHDHLIKDEEVEKIAYRNAYSSKNLFLGKPNFNYLLFYLLLLSKYSIKFLLNRDKVEKQRMRGFLGLKWKE